jgi:uncharacterized protein involved in type VI secretion and phage assembly
MMIPPAPNPLLPALTAALTLGQVTSNDDPDSRGRVKVKLSAVEVEVWASVATASAGNGFGVQMLPRVNEIVVVAFITPELPVVLGSLWVGSSPMPSDATPVDSRYVITTPQGTVMLFDDQNGPKLTVTTPQGNKLVLSDESGGQALMDVGGTTVKLTSSKVEIQASSQVEVQAGQVKISAGQVSVDAALANFSGVVRCQTLQATAVIGTTYTPGAGNIW